MNENNITNGIPDSLEQNLALLDELGSTKTYNNYPNGWAMAFNTPFKCGSATSSTAARRTHASSLANRVKAKGEIREQYHHATILSRRSKRPREAA